MLPPRLTLCAFVGILMVPLPTKAQPDFVRSADQGKITAVRYPSQAVANLSSVQDWRVYLDGWSVPNQEVSEFPGTGPDRSVRPVRT
jgi:hypothetical protein